jgi:glycosyltransferase involved in cell wall biosynthesis
LPGREHESDGFTTAGSIVQVTLWNSPYLGNFMLSELALASEVRKQFGLGTHFVLAPGADGQPWLSQLEAAGGTWSILPDDRGTWRAHLDEVVHAQRAKLIHSHFTEADLQAAGVAAAAGIPCVWHLHTGFTGYPLVRRVTDLFKLRIVARRRVARLIAVSTWLAELAARRGAPRARIETVPNAIATERFAQLPDRPAARAQLGLDADAIVVLCLGWWPEIKGVDLFVDAVDSIAARHPTLNALLVGEEKMRSFLLERSPEMPGWLRVSDFVDDSASLFSAADIFVSASRAEGQSSAIGEAFACELPVVMSNIPGTSPWGQAPAVLTFGSERVDRLAGAIERLVEESPQARNSSGRRNRQWLEENFALPEWCQRVCAIYRELL